MMHEKQGSTEWTAARGEKWRTHSARMEAMLTPVDEPLIRALNLDGPCRIADVGCGGGGTTVEILRRAPEGSVVHGFDISAASIEQARSRTESRGAAMGFEVADVATASRPGEPYDRLVSRFGMMFFDDPLAAFTNLRRWLAPGGRFAFAVWGPIAENEWMSSVRQVVSEIVDLPAPKAEAPGPFRYAQADKLLALLDRAGYCELDSDDWRGVFAVGGGLPAPEAADFALAAFSSFADLLAEAGGAARDRAQQVLTDRFADCEREGVVVMSACVHIVTGAVPR